MAFQSWTWTSVDVLLVMTSLCVKSIYECSDSSVQTRTKTLIPVYQGDLMIDSCPFRSMSIGPQIRLIQTLTLKKRSRSWVWPKRKPHGWPIIQLTYFLFGSHQSDQKFLTWSYFRIWPWKIQDKGWGQRSRSHNWPSIQPSHFLFHINWTIPEIWPNKHFFCKANVYQCHSRDFGSRSSYTFSQIYIFVVSNI